MSEGELIGLLVSCAVSALVGFHGYSYGGAHLIAGFTALAVFAAWTNHTGYGLLQIFAPVAFAYGAAWLHVEHDKSSRE